MLRALVFDVGNVLLKLRTKELLAAMETACPGWTAKAILEEHWGGIDIERVAEGGTTAILWMPIPA